jgi:hypothetical protein
MPDTLADLYGRLNPDAARDALGFSPEVLAAHETMFRRGATAEEIVGALAAWLGRYQPCLFGRMAAKAGLIHYCILTESDLTQSDEAIRDKIQAERTEWTRQGFEGRKSAFIILAVTHKIATAAPDDVLKDFAARLCSLYLLEEDIEEDRIYLDEIFLEVPTGRRTIWQWQAGVNVFSASGDRRWWQDHRIPGGIGFSINSVGHLVKSKEVLGAIRELHQKLGDADEGFPTTKVGDTLGSALEFAMRTIDLATEAVSGRATELLPVQPEDRQSLPACPVQLPKPIADKSHCEYRGYYHTDVTIPSDYFRADVKRPAEIEPILLDFTYLFRDHVDNPTHSTMGAGRRLRGTSGGEKLGRSQPEEIPWEQAPPRLLSALKS